MDCYSCGNCNEEFGGKSYNYLHFANGGFIICPRCDKKLAPVYNFQLMRRIIRLFFGSLAIGILAFFICALCFGMELSVLNGALFLLPSLPALIIHECMELEFGERPIKTRVLLNNKPDE